MLTSRACWFLLSVLVVLSLGLLRPSLPLALLGLTLLLWFAAQWLWFLVCLSSVRRLRVVREVRDDRSSVATLWAKQTFEVHGWLLHDEWLPTPHVAAIDAVPFAIALEPQVGSASPFAQGVVTAEEPLEWTYRMRCGAAGLARFEGVRLRIADWQGFFYHVHFVHEAVELPILPVLTPRVGQTASTKRNNLLLPPGIHRYRRPGSGSELLDLRDYLPGDPPKTIAWKVSARRDRLITKEFESEVPVRCTLFVDTSSSVRVPTDQNLSGGRQPPESQKTQGADAPRSEGVERIFKALDRLVEIAAAVLQANAANRDLTGLLLFDESGVRSIAPDRGGAHRAQCLQMLAEAAGRMPMLQRVDPDPLLPLAYRFAAEVYPELLHPSVNAVPRALLWLEGVSASAGQRRRGWFEILHRRKGVLRAISWWASFWSLLLPLSLLAARVYFKAKVLDAPLLYAVFLCPLITLALWIGTMFLFGVDAATGGRKRKRDWMRKQLAALLSVRYGLAPGGLAALLEDDDAFALHLQRFLNDHHVPYSLPLYTAEGRYAFASAAKVTVLAEALVRAVGKGRDNELFVLLVDLRELEDKIDPLLRAVRVALARHHQVILLCPLEQTADNGAFVRLRRTFARLGVPVLSASGQEPVSLILSRLERLRSLGRPHS